MHIKSNSVSSYKSLYFRVYYKTLKDVVKSHPGISYSSQCLLAHRLTERTLHSNPNNFSRGEGLCPA